MPLAFALALSLGVGVPVQAAAPPGTAVIDVLVTDAHGRPVETLTAADFSVEESGVPLVVESARFVRAASPPASPADESAIDATSRLFGIVLDEYHVTPGPAADRVRDALVQFVRQDLAAGDLLAVIRPLDSLLAITLTADRDAAIGAIEAFDPRQGDYTPRSSFEREFFAGAPSRIDTARAQIVASSVNAMAAYLGRFAPLRKTLILVSAGFPGRGFRQSDSLLPGFATGARTANRGHVAVYAIDPSEDPDPQSGDGATRNGASARAALRALASETAGREAAAGPDPRVPLRAALADASGYYVLALARTSAERDGRFHAVEVTAARRDLVVRARRGYWAESAVASRPAAESASLLSAFSSRLPRRTSPLIRPWFGMARGDQGDTRVSFVWEPAPRVPGDRSSGQAPARVALTVTTLDGQPVFDGVVRAAGALASSAGDERSMVSFRAAPGRLLVQMAIQDVATRVVDREVRDLVVGAFSNAVSIGTAEVLRARTARERRSLAADPDAIPVAARQFSRAEQLLIRIPVFTSGEEPEVSARLTSSLGGVMRQLKLSSTPSRPGVFQIDLPLAALAAGSYIIDVRATTSAGDARDSLPIRVTP